VKHLSLLFCSLLSTACFGSPPQVAYYRLNVPETVPTHAAAEAAQPVTVSETSETAPAVCPGDGQVVLEELEASAVYSDARIVYRQSPHRHRYYHYHRWSSLPSTQVSNFLRRAWERTGHFERVLLRRDVNEPTLVVSGRLQAFEEVDLSDEKWIAHVALVLDARDPETDEIVWSQRYDEKEPMPERSPEGLAHSMSVALGRIASQSAPAVAELDRLAEKCQPAPEDSEEAPLPPEDD
jgi:ABC-type uncharacterized transport system auxiliary subunit